MTEIGEREMGEKVAAASDGVRPALGGIQHVGLTVTDLAASEAWYGRVLGLHRAFDEPHHGSEAGGYAVVLGAEGLPFNIGLDHHPANDGSPFTPLRTGLDHVCFQVASRDAIEDWVLHLDQLGVPHSGITEFDAMGMHFALVNFRDPDGIALELLAVS
jgi:glyoxylase I family protein